MMNKSHVQSEIRCVMFVPGPFLHRAIKDLIIALSEITGVQCNVGCNNNSRFEMSRMVFAVCNNFRIFLA